MPATIAIAGADNLPTLVMHGCASYGVLCNGRRLSGFSDQVVTVAPLPDSPNNGTPIDTVFEWHWLDT